MDENTGAQPFRVGPFGPWDLLEEQRLTDYVLSELIKATDRFRLLLGYGGVIVCRNRTGSQWGAGKTRGVADRKASGTSFDVVLHSVVRYVGCTVCHKSGREDGD